ncbi:transmembrane protein [Cystoisospora suis]|uniref:Transmembrane protein n=1 Tax=Cystoisospora suis TaxID=483139 RepID=A0A2C6JX02_9APIC|nr:transmembrane protein [Cystoisospora suis]
MEDSILPSKREKSRRLVSRSREAPFSLSSSPVSHQQPASVEAPPHSRKPVAETGRCDGRLKCDTDRTLLSSEPKKAIWRSSIRASRHHSQSYSLSFFPTWLSSLYPFFSWLPPPYLLWDFVVKKAAFLRRFPWISLPHFLSYSFLTSFSPSSCRPFEGSSSTRNFRGTFLLFCCILLLIASINCPSLLLSTLFYPGVSCPESFAEPASSFFSPPSVTPDLFSALSPFPSVVSPFLPASAFKLISDSCNDAYIDLSDGISRKNETLTVRLRQGRSLILTHFDETRFTMKPSSFKRQAYQVHAKQPSFCDTRELINYTAYFIFTAPLTDFWSRTIPEGLTFPSYAFTWPTGSQRVTIRGGICFELTDDKYPEHNLFIIIRPSGAQLQLAPSLFFTSLSLGLPVLSLWWY